MSSLHSAGPADTAGREGSRCCSCRLSSAPQGWSGWSSGGEKLAVKQSDWSAKQNRDSDTLTSSAGQNRVKLGRPAGFLLLVSAALGAVPAACSQGSLTPHCLSATQPTEGRRERRRERRRDEGKDGGKDGGRDFLRRSSVNRAPAVIHPQAGASGSTARHLSLMGIPLVRVSSSAKTQTLLRCLVVLTVSFGFYTPCTPSTTQPATLVLHSLSVKVSDSHIKGGRVLTPFPC